MEFDKYIFGEFVKNPKYIKQSEEIEMKDQQAHLQFLSNLGSRGLLLCAGPFEGGGGILFFDAAKTTIDELKELCSTDPHVIAGRHTLRFKILYTAKGNLKFEKFEAPI